MKTVAVLGASYGGTRAAQILAQELPEGWRVVLIDRNSHFNHLYVLPRFAILPQHAQKAFIPYTNVFRTPSATNGEEVPKLERHVLVHAQVTYLSKHSVTLSRSLPELGLEGDTSVLNFEYAIYALGSHLPAPINLWSAFEGMDSTLFECGTKKGGIEWLRRFRAVIQEAASVLVVGGGALGVQYATDIAEVYPDKPVTLLHSRDRLLPRFDEAMHEEIVAALAALNVTVILGERLDLESLNRPPVFKDGQRTRTVTTQRGRDISAGIVLLCTGQTPNTSMMQAILPDSIVPDGPSKGMIRVKRTMQVAVPAAQSSSGVQKTGAPPVSSVHRTVAEEEQQEECDQEDNDDGDFTVPYNHLFAIGDAADAFGAINAGHTAYYQGEIAARNIVELIRRSESPSEGTAGDAKLQHYKPGPPAIKVSLGLSKSLYEVGGVVGKKYDASEDLDAPLMWKFYGIETDESAMYQ